MAAETLQEYLVKLGWDVDALGLDNANKAVDGFKKNVNGIGSQIVKSFGIAGAAVFSFITTSVVGMGKLLETTAKADLQVERLARKMWTTEENARSFSIALNAMGASYDDIFSMTPEEFRNFQDLRSLGNGLQAPDELQNNLVLIREIGQEFNRLKVIVNYASQWVSYYITEYLGTTITNVRDNFRSFNEWLVTNIPTITAKIAQFFVIMVKLGQTVVQTFQNLIGLFSRLFSRLSDGAKRTGAVIAGFVALLATGPIGWFIAALVAILALLDDFYTWQRGGRSAFGDTWEKITGAFSNVDTSGLDELYGKFDTLLVTLGDVGGALFDLGADFIGLMDDLGVFQIVWDLVIGKITNMVNALQGVLDLLLLITGNFDKLAENSFFNKIIAFNPDGSVAFGKTVANLGVGAVDSVAEWADNNNPFFDIPAPSEVLGFEYQREIPVRASGVQGVFSEQNTAPREFTQNNNINVVAAPGESADVTARKTAGAILRQRKQYDSFK